MNEPGSDGPGRDDEPGHGRLTEDETPQYRRGSKKKVVFRGQGVMVATGPSGREYRFPGHGSVIKMVAEDAEDLAARARKVRACCGKGVVERRLFALV